jgi:hypothetical protein
MIVPFSTHGWLATTHGVLFGVAYLLLLVLALGAVTWLRPAELTPLGLTLTERQLGLLVTAAAVLAWIAVISGTWGLYPWFRARDPGSPAESLLADPSLAYWARWVVVSKEWIAWGSAAVVTVAALARYRWRARLPGSVVLRRRLAGLLILALAGAAYAGVIGTLLAKLAPLE